VEDKSNSGALSNEIGKKIQIDVDGITATDLASAAYEAATRCNSGAGDEAAKRWKRKS
jgi:hypothetical protein